MIWFAVIIFSAIVMTLAYDIYRAARYGFTETLSYWMLLNSVKYPIIPAMLGFVFGLLIGHFFWDQLLNVTVPCPVSQ